MNKVLIAILFFGFALCAGQPAKDSQDDCRGCLPELVDPISICLAKVGFLDANKIKKCVEGAIGYDNGQEDDCGGCLPELLDPLSICLAEVGYLDANFIAKCMEVEIAGHDSECFDQICCAIEH